MESEEKGLKTLIHLEVYMLLFGTWIAMAVAAEPEDKPHFRVGVCAGLPYCVIALQLEYSSPILTVGGSTNLVVSRGFMNINFTQKKIFQPHIGASLAYTPIGSTTDLSVYGGTSLIFRRMTFRLEVGYSSWQHGIIQSPFSSGAAAILFNL